MSSNVVTVEVHGLAELEKALKDFAEDVATKSLRSAVYAGAATIQKEIKQRAPVGTVPHWIGLKKKGRLVQPGNLRKQIVIKHMRSSRYSVTYAVRLAGNGFYGKFLEFGTSKMAARPFFRPGFDASKERAVEAIKKRLALNIERAARKAEKANRAELRGVL